MKDEGSRVKNADGSDGLDHCVGGYASKCACSRTRVVSLRKRADDGREARISTAEIDMDRRNAVVVQHRGRKNGPPPADAETALSKYLAAISDGTLAVDLASIEPTREHAGETIADAAGYEWHVPGNVEKAWSAWSAFLPRAARTWNATDVAEYVKQASAEAVEGSIA
jgi:hypothetical protein